MPATGISIGVDRLLAALRAKGRIGDQAQGPVVVTVMDRDRMADYQAMAAELRAAGDPGGGLPGQSQGLRQAAASTPTSAPPRWP